MKKAFAFALAALSTPAVLAQSPDAVVRPAPVAILAVQPVGVIGNASGTGKYPAIAESVASLQGNTIYRPERMPSAALPLLLWGNGGCRDNGLRYAQFMREVASHGFFIIAAGYARYERALQPAGTAAATPDATAAAAPDDGQASLGRLQSALDWAAQANADESSPFKGKIDLDQVGVMGTSCGGLQAIAMLTDPRVKTAIGFNTGVLISIPPTAAPDSDLVIKKEALQKLNGPIAYINGGPTDIAYENALDDLKLITKVPVFFAENGVGHGGTYLFDEQGGAYSAVANAWFSWQLKGDQTAAKWFRGSDCKLCKEPGWAVRKKQFYGE